MTRAEANRARIILHAKRTKIEIEQMFSDFDHWNRCVRKPDEAPIDIDPDGCLAVFLVELNQLIAAEHTDGPLPDLPDVPRGLVVVFVKDSL